MPVVKRRISAYFNSDSCVFLIFSIRPVFPVLALGKDYILWSSSPCISLVSAVTSVLCAGTSASSGKSNGLPITKHAGMEGGGGWCTALLIPNFEARLGGWSTPDPGRFTPPKNPSTHCTGGWVVPRAGLDSCVEEKISFPHWCSKPDHAYPV